MKRFCAIILVFTLIFANISFVSAQEVNVFTSTQKVTELKPRQKRSAVIKKIIKVVGEVIIEIIIECADPPKVYLSDKKDS